MLSATGSRSHTEPMFPVKHDGERERLARWTGPGDDAAGSRAATPFGLYSVIRLSRLANGAERRNRIVDRCFP